MLEAVVTETPSASRRDIADEVLSHLTVAERAEALETALPAYIGVWMSERRQWRPEPLPAAFQDLEPQFAADDLLSGPAQQIETLRQNKMLKARGSAKVNATRDEWQRHFADSLWTGAKTVKFGDATAEDLLAAAAVHRDKAKANFDSMLEKAAWYEGIAETLQGSQKVRDLTNDPTRV